MQSDGNVGRCAPSSDLSEKAYCAGWMDNLEYAFWQAVLGERQNYGRLVFTVGNIGHLKRLAGECAGWIVFDDERDETWVPLEEWEERFAAWLRTSVAKRIDG